VKKSLLVPPRLPPTTTFARPDNILRSSSLPVDCNPIVKVDILALQSSTFGGGSVVAVPMAHPDVEPVEEYEYVLA
jgi:hypothetical protein